LYGHSTSFSVEASLLVGAMITVLWIVLTFSLTFAEDANGDQILGFPKDFYMFAHVGAQANATYASTIPFSIFAIFELAFPILAASLVVQALIGTNFVFLLLFSFSY
jgi:Amt family ammonium transporter